MVKRSSQRREIMGAVVGWDRIPFRMIRIRRRLVYHPTMTLNTR